MFYKIGDFAKIIGKTPRTLINWDLEGKFKPAYITCGKHRMYSEEQLEQFIIKPKKDKKKINVGYIRVSTSNQKEDLNRQKELMELYLAAKGHEFKIISDIGSGINFNKKGLISLLEMINNKEINTLCILYKDRLVRFGFELIELQCKLNDVKIEIINNDDFKTDEQEMIDDILNIIHVFSCKMNGKRSHINKKIMEKLNEK